MNNVKYSKDGKKLLKYQGDESSFIVPDGVTVIGERAFEGCTKLTPILSPTAS